MLAYFSSDISTAAKEAVSTRFQQFVEKALNTCNDVKGVSYGWGVEDDFPIVADERERKGTLFMALIGWPSIGAHMAFKETKAYKENVELITEMEGMVDLGMVHVACRSVERKD